MKTFLLILFILATPCLSWCQETDTVFEYSPDSTSIDSDEGTTYSENDEVIYKAPADSAAIDQRMFDQQKIYELKSDPDLSYKQPPTIAESLWDRFLRWFGQLLREIVENAVTTNWGRVLVYALGLALAVVIIMMLLKVNAFKILYSADGTKQKYQVLDENIHEMDFEALIQEAIAQQDYRRGVRLVFLYALKLLSDKQFIHWQTGKTNHDYAAELNVKELKSGFNQLSFYFDYAWYGNFAINRDTFSKIQTTFADWRVKIN